jgi:hypothetical protein
MNRKRIAIMRGYSRLKRENKLDLIVKLKNILAVVSDQCFFKMNMAVAVAHTAG